MKFWKRLLARLVQLLPGKIAAPGDLPISLYSSAMVTRFNRLHRWIFPRFFKKVQVEGAHLQDIQALPKEASIVYISSTIGQLEYNYYNFLYVKNKLPLPQYGDHLSLLFWRPWSDWKRMAYEYLNYIKKNGALPSPVRAGWLAEWMGKGIPVFLQIRTSRFHDDRYWEDPKEDPLNAVIEAAKTRQVYCIPQEFLWNKHPSRPRRTWALFLLGERGERGIFRRLLSFFFYAKRRAVVKVGEPFCVNTWLTGKEGHDLARDLRTTLLELLHSERLSITGPSIKPRTWLIEQTLQDEAVQRTAYDLAQASGKSVASVQNLARQYADEIAGDMHYSIIEPMARTMKWVMDTLFESVHMDEQGMQVVRQAVAKGPVILVPNHRSHMDYMIISTFFYLNNVAVPFIAGGINMNFWPVGPLFRRCGSYFLRRTFGGNPLYKAVFQSYVGQLVKEGYCQEFFIEGGRSRTGKLAHPKLGMLSMLVESWMQGASSDITFIPISITYDQVLEVGSYAKEISGGVKTSERARDLLKLWQFFRRRWGKVDVHFGDPISLAEVSRQVAPSKPELTQVMAQSILYAINKGTQATALSLASTVLLTRASTTLVELNSETRLLLQYLQWKGVRTAPELDHLDTCMGATINRLHHTKWIEAFPQFHPPVYKVKERLLLDYAKNSNIHFFVSISCLAKLVLCNSLFSEIVHRYLLMKKLFAHEFNFSTRRDMAPHLRTLLDYFVSQHWIDTPEPMIYQLSHSGRIPLSFFASLLDNYWETYRVAFQFARVHAGQTQTEKQWLRMIMQYARDAEKLGQIKHPEAVSKSIFQNAFLLLQELQMMTQQGEWHMESPNSLFLELDGLLTSINT